MDDGMIGQKRDVKGNSGWWWEVMNEPYIDYKNELGECWKQEAQR